jgi:hypothetical protein
LRAKHQIIFWEKMESCNLSGFAGFKSGYRLARRSSQRKNGECGRARQQELAARGKAITLELAGGWALRASVLRLVRLSQ